MSVDTTMAALISTIPGNLTIPDLIQSEKIRFDGTTRIAVRDDRVVFVDSESYDWPLLHMDITYGPWQQAIDAEPVPDQEIEVTYQNDRWQITTTDDFDGTLVQTICEFDAALGWAPFNSRMLRDGVIVEERIFGYQSTALPSVRPSVAPRAQLQANGMIRLTLHLIDSWNPAVDANELDLRIPPMRLQID